MKRVALMMTDRGVSRNPASYPSGAGSANRALHLGSGGDRERDIDDRKDRQDEFCAEILRSAATVSSAACVDARHVRGRERHAQCAELATFEALQKELHGAFERSKRKFDKILFDRERRVRALERRGPRPWTDGLRLINAEWEAHLVEVYAMTKLGVQLENLANKWRTAVAEFSDGRICDELGATPLLDATTPPGATPLLDATTPPGATPLLDATTTPGATPLLDATTPPGATPLLDATTPLGTTPLHDETTPPGAAPLHDAKTPPGVALLLDATTPPSAAPLLDAVTPPGATPLLGAVTPPGAKPLLDATTPLGMTPLLDTTTPPGATPPLDAVTPPGATPLLDATTPPGATPLLDTTTPIGATPLLGAVAPPGATRLLDATTPLGATPLLDAAALLGAAPLVDTAAPPGATTPLGATRSGTVIGMIMTVVVFVTCSMTFFASASLASPSPAHCVGQGGGA